MNRSVGNRSYEVMFEKLDRTISLLRKAKLEANADAILAAAVRSRAGAAPSVLQVVAGAG